MHIKSTERAMLTAAALLALSCGSNAPNPSSAGAVASSDVTANTNDVSMRADTTSTPDIALVDTAVDTKMDTGPDCELIGTTGQPPTQTVGLPTMTAVVNQDGVAVQSGILKGNWTVMWFYPAASTAG
ncbi:MAG TPA: hypothetical protein DCQ06_08680 [Myxococcales bacterium]|nr:hypothetical protein [Myxococcales bacterium]